jgi:hypothetical protein
MLLLGVASGLVKEQTFASFTSTAIGANDPFTGGSVVLSVGETTGTLAAANLGLNKSYRTIVTVQNTGNNTLRYSLAIAVSSGSTSLGNTLQLSIKDGPIVSNACTGNTVMVSGNLNGGGFGSSAVGQQSGDRSLAASSSENLCFTITNPITQASTLTDYTTTLTYTFTAEQTAGT